jgi:acetylglutamate kinase
MNMKNKNNLQQLQEKFKNKMIVIKYGGNAMTSKAAAVSLMKDIIFLQSLNISIVLVHGGGPEINAMLKKAGIESRFIGGLRYTDKESVDIVQMVLAGKVNKDLSLLASLCGGKAIGLSGLDSNILTAEKLKSEFDLGYVGQITKVNEQPIIDVLKMGYLPILSTVACDDAGNIYNINADTAAGAVAVKLKAAAFVLLTDVKGILLDKEDETSLIKKVSAHEAKQYIDQGIINGGMIPKAQCCIYASKNGVKGAYIMDGRKENILINGLLGNRNEGTMFINSQ